MKVILQKDIPKIGKKDEIKEVADGYARNYLIPRGLAVEASAGRVQELKLREANRARRAEKEQEEALRQARKLEGQDILLKVAAGEGGRLFGSVTSADIAAALQAKGINIERKKIALPEPIKTLGRHTVEVKLHPRVIAPVTIIVEKKE